jgi:hypothetical protein
VVVERRSVVRMVNAALWVGSAVIGAGVVGYLLWGTLRDEPARADETALPSVAALQKKAAELELVGLPPDAPAAALQAAICGEYALRLRAAARGGSRKPPRWPSNASPQSGGGTPRCGSEAR